MKRFVAALMLLSSAAFAHGYVAPVIIPVPVQAPAPVDDANGVAMNPTAFGIFADQFRAAWYDDKRLNLLARDKPVLSSAEVDLLLGKMDDDLNRLTAVQLIAPKLADPQNRIEFYGWFTSDAQQAALAKIFPG
jgi:hypothetical protein